MRGNTHIPTNTLGKGCKCVWSGSEAASVCPRVELECVSEQRKRMEVEIWQPPPPPADMEGLRVKLNELLFLCCHASCLLMACREINICQCKYRKLKSWLVLLWLFATYFPDSDSFRSSQFDSWYCWQFCRAVKIKWTQPLIHQTRWHTTIRSVCWQKPIFHGGTLDFADTPRKSFLDTLHPRSNQSS